MDNSGKDSTAYSSEDEIQRPVVKRKKKAKSALATSSEEEDSDIEIKPRRLTKPLRCESEDENNNSLNGISSTSSASKNCVDSSNELSDNDQVDKCAICLNKFLGQDIATPETCDHVFCLECIQEWSRNINTCPIDRLKFNLILVRHHKEEKIIQTIVVNKVPYESDSEESFGQADFCDICGEDKNEGAIFFRCYECSKFYHYHCIAPILPRTHSVSWQCPACENHNWGTASHRITPSAFRVYRSLNSGVRTHSPAQTTLHSASQEFLRLRRRVLYPRAATVIQRLLSSSDSSEEDTVRSAVSSTAYQNPLISSVAAKASCPLLKRRRNLCRARNRALVSATSAAAESRYGSDSDDEYRLPSTPAPESFDLVGSILESQTRLHCPDILTLTRDGTLLPTPKTTDSNRSSNSASSTQNSEDSARSSFSGSLPFGDNSVSPFTSNAVVRQRPLNPTHNNSSKYGETSMPTYSCSTSGASRERTLTYDETVTARPAHGANSNDRFGNDPMSPVVQKGFCVSATGDEIKKDGRAAKGQHSEDEVDIYSDIESVNEEDGLTSDSVEPPKVAYKCDDSQLSNPNDSSDSSDNDLVIDEDQHIEEDHEKVKKSQDPNPGKSDQICESEESNMSSNAGSDQEQLMIDTSPQNPRSPHLENSSDNCYNPGGDSSHGMFVNDASNHSKSNLGGDSSPGMFVNDTSNHSKSNPGGDSPNGVFVNDDSNHSKSNPCDVSPRGVFVNDENNHLKMNSEQRDESDSDAGQQASDVEMHEDGDISLDSTKKSYLGDVSTPGTSGKSSPKSCRGETADGFENSASNENSRSNLDNVSSLGQEESKEVFEEVSNQGNENTCNSASGGEVEDFENENNSNLSEDQVREDKNLPSEKHFNFTSNERNTSVSEPEELMDEASSPVLEETANNVDLIDICNDISMKSDEEDNLDSLENASTPCMDENLDGQMENSPMHVEHSEEEEQDDGKTSPNVSGDEIETNGNENVEKKAKSVKTSKIIGKELSDGSVELGGVEDISDLGSEVITAELNDEVLPPVDTTDKDFDDVERKVASLFSPDHEDDDCIEISKQDDGEFKKSLSPQTNQSFEDQEEGEIIEERPVHRCKKKKNRSQQDDTGEYGEYAPRVSISDLPRIPKLKRDKDRDSIPKTLSFESKRSSVMSRVDLGEDVSWKRLSKHTKERSYRDGRPRDEKLLYRERESRKKSKKSNEAARRNDSKNSERRRDDKKSETEKSKDYDSRSRKSEKSKTSDYDYSDREKRKLNKDKHSSKDRHSKDKREKDKYDKKYSKEDKYSKEKSKDEIRYERDLRFDKEERFERIVYEKGKFKEKEHKSKHKDRKSESSKTCKEHSREKHKHTHSSDRFSDKQREVRKIDDKIKIVVEQKDGRKEKSKHKERKEIKIEKKPIIQRKVEPPERSPSYKEITSIESKEIFAKGDSIIINVNFNRALSPKVTSVPEGGDVNSKERKILLEEKGTDENLTSLDKNNKSKQISPDKNKTSSDSSNGKRPSTPTGKNSSVLSVSESYWQGGEDPDGNNSPASDKSVEIITIDPENKRVGSPEIDSQSSPETITTQSGAKESVSVPEKTLTPNNEVTESVSKENDSFSSKRRSPRSPSPPSPADNDSYDPCEPTRSPSPPPIPSPPPLPSANPKPPPSPELPPLPPEPEPTEDSHRPKKPDFAATPVPSSSQAITVQTQTSSASPMQGILLPPSFLSRVSAANSLQSMSPLAQSSRNGNFQMNNHGSVLLPPNQMQQLISGNFLPHMHTNTALPPPPNPPSMAHMTSVPPPPPPPAGMTMLSQARHPRLPTLNPNTLLQSLTMVHGVNSAPMQLIHHLPPNLSGILTNHQTPMVQNPPTTSHPVSNIATNQQVLRMVFSQNQMSNHGALLPTPTANKTQGNLVPLNSQTLAAHQKAENKRSKRSPSAEKNEVIDMDVGTPYSPGDSPSVDSVADYSPACSPEASSPKNKDAFDTLFTGNQRTSEKRTYDALSSNEKAKTHSATKKSKHEHKKHAIRMQMKDKHKKSRKDQKQADEAQLKILDELPSSAVEMQVKEKFLKKLNRQERVVEEVKMVLKPFYKSRDVTKEEYKDILRKAVPKICHNRSGEINPVKVKSLVESYVKKAKHSRKKGDKRKSKFS